MNNSSVAVMYAIPAGAASYVFTVVDNDLLGILVGIIAATCITEILFLLVAELKDEQP